MRYQQNKKKTEKEANKRYKQIFCGANRDDKQHRHFCYERKLIMSIFVQSYNTIY